MSPASRIGIGLTAVAAGCGTHSFLSTCISRQSQLPAGHTREFNLSGAELRSKNWPGQQHIGVMKIRAKFAKAGDCFCLTSSFIEYSHENLLSQQTYDLAISQFWALDVPLYTGKTHTHF